jgi:CheY-like chemotaxis protein
MMQEQRATIFYMDDDTDDVQLLIDVFHSIDTSYQVRSALNGDEGLRQLTAMKQTGDLPCLIILDINMPKLDGKETFKRLNADPELSQIPLVVFSTSNNGEDKKYFQGQNVEYITKPFEYAVFIETARRLLNLCVRN